ncbi:tetratricopeptide repeat protein [Capnocytophaga felis]|uniref:Tetratricopeptide repeat protein n=1 Tax=Capnocytophaga felis TaxID=2267611 RepID=A0A5M4B993_9FLAO|nr:tetratricopeptide repeat protein [Capnocytophaga felis]GET45676.1 hypothetical protein RCZ01_09780 [Capnocytophaga felis]GET47900.1 hypothetical protein RCZ02_07310 [Capnocytophaga felis]
MSDTCVNHIENYWKILTEDANESFKKGKYELALEGYLNALYRAEVLNNNLSDCFRLKVPFLQLYIVSHNNLANCYEKLNLIEKSEESLRKVVFFILYFFEKKLINQEEMNSELKKSVVTYLNFIKSNNLQMKDENLFFELLRRYTKETELQKLNTLIYA